MSAPRFQQAALAPNLVGWDAVANTNFQKTREWLDAQPLCLKRFYRVSASNSQSPSILNLVNFDAANHEGALVYLRDPEGGQKPLVYSNGVNWKYVVSDTNVTGIS